MIIGLAVQVTQLLSELY